MKPAFIVIAGALASSLLLSTLAMGDNDGDDERRGYNNSRNTSSISNQLYKKECGSCHMAYQPNFLPQRSWEKLMTNLNDHFNENAEVDTTTQRELTAYLKANAADSANYRRPMGIAWGDTPLRITDTRYFRRQHNEISRRYVEDNPKVKSFSRCELCHTGADNGSYNEHQIRIPGYGRWED